MNLKNIAEFYGLYLERDTTKNCQGYTLGDYNGNWIELPLQVSVQALRRICEEWEERAMMNIDKG